jgi:hypothetical protein
VKIVGIEGMSPQDIEFELQRGGRFVVFLYCVSVLVMTFKRPSAIYFIRAGEGTGSKSIPFTLISLVLGWWGIPWGPIWTISSVVTNLRGGKDVTKAIAATLSQATAAAPA